MATESMLESLGQRISLIERAATYDGRTREKILALAEADRVYCGLYPQYYRAIQAIRMVEQLGSASVPGNNIFQIGENRLLSLVLKVVVDAVYDGDLALQHKQRPSEIAFALWNFAFGTRAMMNCQTVTFSWKYDDYACPAQDTTTLFLDSLGWKPLTCDWNYAHTRLQIQGNLFAREWEQIRAMNGNNKA